MVDTSEVETALCELINGIIPFHPISCLEDVATGSPFIKLLVELDTTYFTELKAKHKSKKITSIADIDSDEEDFAILRWNAICESLDSYVEKSDVVSGASQISNGVDVVLLSQGNKAELINIMFIYMTLMVTNKISLWDSTLSSMSNQTSINLLNQIKENLSDEDKSVDTPSPRKKGSGTFQSTTNFGFLKQATSTERNMDLVDRVENLEEKLLEEREVNEDLRFKIK